MSGWITPDAATPVAEAQAVLPRAPGKYAFFVDDLAQLPSAFRNEAQARPLQRLMYLGKADVSLAIRVWEEECQHRRPGTFFRSVGAMLGYRSPKGGRNCEFAPDDKIEILQWIKRHLLVAWTCEAAMGSHRVAEQELIRQFTPLLNLQGNPRKFIELERLRAACRQGQVGAA